MSSLQAWWDPGLTVTFAATWPCHFCCSIVAIDLNSVLFIMAWILMIFWMASMSLNACSWWRCQAFVKICHAAALLYHISLENYATDNNHPQLRFPRGFHLHIGRTTLLIAKILTSALPYRHNSRHRKKVSREEHEFKPDNTRHPWHYSAMKVYLTIGILVVLCILLIIAIVVIGIIKHYGEYLLPTYSQSIFILYA